MEIESDGPEFNYMSTSTSTGGMVFDHAGPAGWILGEIFIEDFPARLSYTGICRYVLFLPPSHQLLSHSSPIPHLFLAQRLLNYPEKAISGVVLFGLASMKQSFRWRYSRISRTGGFEPRRRVCPLLVSSSISHLSFLLLFLPHRTS